MHETWNCPVCGRSFSRKGQRHACGTRDRGQVLKSRAASVVAVYEAIEAYATSLGRIEIVARERYVLFRSRSIFADVTIMTDGIRVAIHLHREFMLPMLMKVVRDKKGVTHVAKLTTPPDLPRLEPYLRVFAFTAKKRGRAITAPKLDHEDAARPRAVR